MIGFKQKARATIFRANIVVRPASGGDGDSEAANSGEPGPRRIVPSKNRGGAIDIVSDEGILDAPNDGWRARKAFSYEQQGAAPMAGLLRACDLKNAARFNGVGDPGGIDQSFVT